MASNNLINIYRALYNKYFLRYNQWLKHKTIIKNQYFDNLLLIQKNL
jgi:hypothetical protein